MSKFYTIELGPEHLSPFLKIYLKDTAKNSEVKLALEDIPAVDHVNITQKVNKKADLTVYPNKAYEIKEARDEIATFLDHYFTEINGVLASPTGLPQSTSDSSQREAPAPAVAAISSPPSPGSQPDQSEGPVISQQATVTHGNTYQAGRDLHVHESPRSPVRKTNWLTKTRIVISIITGIIGIAITLFFTLPEKFKKSAEKPLTDSTRNNPSILVTGIVKEMGSDRVIPYCNITSNLNSRDTLQTTSAGTFQFQVTGSAGQSIHIFAWAKGYKPWNEIQTLGSAIEIKLDRK